MFGKSRCLDGGEGCHSKRDDACEEGEEVVIGDGGVGEVFNDTFVGWDERCESGYECGW